MCAADLRIFPHSPGVQCHDPRKIRSDTAGGIVKAPTVIHAVVHGNGAALCLDVRKSLYIIVLVAGVKEAHIRLLFKNSFEQRLAHARPPSFKNNLVNPKREHLVSPFARDLKKRQIKKMIVAVVAPLGPFPTIGVVVLVVDEEYLHATLFKTTSAINRISSSVSDGWFGRKRPL